MNKRFFFIAINILVFSISLYLLLNSSTILSTSISKTINIPIGSFLTWLGIISLPSLLLCSFKKLYQPKTSFQNIFSKIFKVLILFAILWLPFCYYLAGNIAFNFSNTSNFQGGQTAMKIFWNYTYSIVTLTLSVTLLYLFLSIFIKRKK